MTLFLFLALGPVAIILTYIYYRDKYEKEPIKLLLKGLLFGAIAVIPILLVESLLSIFSYQLSEIEKAGYDAVIVAAFTEEVFKFLAVFILIWKSPEFNEKFDGIVYAVFISLGFAAVENIMYVYNYGMPTAITRAFTAVPAHATFGIIMGYYLGFAKFRPSKRSKYIALSIIVPIIFHGIYDFILMSQINLLLLGFIPFIIYMFYYGNKKMKEHSDSSIFKPN